MTEQEQQRGQTEPGREEIASAKSLIQALARAVKGFTIYLPNNPLHRKFFEGLVAAMDSHLENFGDLRLDLGHSQITCREAVIYDNPIPRESLAFRMYADGIRALIFREGLEEGELDTFLKILSRQRREDEDEDIVTELWVSDLPNLVFVLAEDSEKAEVGDLGARRQKDSTTREAIRRLHREEEPRDARQSMKMLETSQTALPFSEEELKAIREEVAHEEERDPTDDVTDILRAILLVEKDTSTFREFLDTTSRLCGDIILIGRIDYALRLIRLTTELAESEEIPPEHREIVIEARTRIFPSAAVEPFRQVLDKTEDVTREQLRALVTSLGRAAIMPFCLLLGDVKRRDMRKYMIEGLVEVGRDSPEDFLPFLSDRRWYLVRNTAHILRKMKTAKVTVPMTALARHDDQRVRSEALLYFEEQEGEEGTRALLQFLEDGDQSLRVSAIKALSRRKDPAALDYLLRATAAAEFRQRELPEREAIYEALGDLDPRRMLPVFSEMLMKNYWFKREQEWEAAVCAIAGLRGIEARETLPILGEALVAKKGRTKALVAKAIEAIGKGRKQS